MYFFPDNDGGSWLPEWWDDNNIPEQETLNAEEDIVVLGTKFVLLSRAAKESAHAFEQFSNAAYMISPLLDGKFE